MRGGADVGRPTDWYVLDLDEDPTPGDPDRVADCAERFLDFAGDVERAERDVKALAGEGAVTSWIGKSGDAFRKEIGELPDQLRKLHTSYRLAGEALDGYAPDLRSAQRQADRALADGREARHRLQVAQASLGGAEDAVSRATAAVSAARETAASVPQPDEAAVRSAVRNASAAQSRLDSARAAVGDAQADLDAAKRLAEQARELREQAAKRCADGIEDGSDAGIKNKPWWSWDKITEFVAEAWDYLVAACKIIVAVLGIVVLIIGGPLAWVVLAAALVVLADTLAKYLQGKASLWDVAFAMLDCIPGGKGLTTAARLKTVLTSGTEMAGVARRGASAIAGAPARLASMSGDVRSAMRVFDTARRAGLDAVPVRAFTVPAIRAAQTADGSQLLMMTTDVMRFRDPLGAARATAGAAREALDTYGSIRTAQILRNGDDTYDVVFRYNRSWDDFQRASADAKADFLTGADTRFSTSGPAGRNPDLTRTWAAQHPIDATSPDLDDFTGGLYDSGRSYDVDHMQDLQLGGADEHSNMSWLESSVNRSEGSQMAGAARRAGLQDGAEITTYVFRDRGVDASHVLRGASYVYSGPSGGQ